MGTKPAVQNIIINRRGPSGPGVHIGARGKLKRKCIITNFEQVHVVDALHITSKTQKNVKYGITVTGRKQLKRARLAVT